MIKQTTEQTTEQKTPIQYDYTKCTSIIKNGDLNEFKELWTAYTNNLTPFKDVKFFYTEIASNNNVKLLHHLFYNCEPFIETGVMMVGLYDHSFEFVKEYHALGCMLTDEMIPALFVFKKMNILPVLNCLSYLLQNGCNCDLVEVENKCNEMLNERNKIEDEYVRNMVHGDQIKAIIECKEVINKYKMLKK